jgi:UDP-GlcNAc:undecaprenyl-phosphate GlcNAc-1-phosphate transferase
LVGCINAINLMDGMDGLASVVGISTAITLGVIASCLGNQHVTVAAVVLAGALAGFFVHNRPPATIYLGDSGSMVIGVVLGILGIQSTLKTSTTLSITAPLVVMTLPMFDTFLAVVRRRLTGRSFDSADRQHIHHRLLDRGMSPWVVLGIIGALCLATGTAATIATIVHRDVLAWATALTLVILAVRLRWFGDYEWSLATVAARRMLATIRTRWTRLRSHPAPVAQRLTRLPARQVWAILVDRARTWDVSRLRLTLGIADRPSWRHEWTRPGSDSETGDGWATAVAVRGSDGWACELRAGGDTADREFLAPAGLVHLLSAFASHFANHKDLVVELANSPPDDQDAKRDEHDRQSRAA